MMKLQQWIMMESNNNHFAEIVESSLQHWIAQSWQWDHFPAYGSLVHIETKKRTLFGIVHQLQTGSLDPIRYPFPYKKTEEELLQEQPQIFEFLKTTFTCLPIGYQEKGTFFYSLAPEPPKIHAFVGTTPPAIAKQFFFKEHYLHLIFNFAHQINNIDELLLALIKHLHALSLFHEETIERFMQTYSLLTGNDYRRIKLFLQRVEHVIQQ